MTFRFWIKNCIFFVIGNITEHTEPATKKMFKDQLMFNKTVTQFSGRKERKDEKLRKEAQIVRILIRAMKIN